VLSERNFGQPATMMVADLPIMVGCECLKLVSSKGLRVEFSPVKFVLGDQQDAAL
jgi:hypothetical protein